MPYSKFTTARLEEDQIVLTGPFGFADEEPPTDVASLHFVLIQGEAAVDGEGGADGGSWDATTDALGLETGPAQGFGVAVLVRRGSPPTVQTFSWSDPVEITT